MAVVLLRLYIEIGNPDQADIYQVYEQEIGDEKPVQRLHQIYKFLYIKR
jgi:hypothetical protein